MTTQAAQGVAQGYAKAILEIARADDVLDEVEDELFRFSRTLQQETQLRETLTNPAVSADAKRKIIQELLSGKATSHTISLLGFVVEQGRTRDLPDIVASLSNLASARRRKEIAEVRVACELKDAQRKQLADALSRTTGKDVEVRVVVDPSVIGGVWAKVGNEVIDGTVRSRLQRLRAQLGIAG